MPTHVVKAGYGDIERLLRSQEGAFGFLKGQHGFARRWFNIANNYRSEHDSVVKKLLEESKKTKNTVRERLAPLGTMLSLDVENFRKFSDNKYKKIRDAVAAQNKKQEGWAQDLATLVN